MLSLSRRPKSWATLTALGLALGGAQLLSPAMAQVSVLTQNGDNARTGANTAETTLTPANVNVTQFGKLFTINGLDANVNGQVLYVPNVVIGGASHNVLYAYQSNNQDNSPSGLAAFDADTGAQLWRDSSSDSSPIIPVSATYTTPTPVIDAQAGIIYVLTKANNDDAGETDLHAIDITTGKEKPGSPIRVQATVAGTGDGSVNGTVSFDGPISLGSSTRFHANDRAGLLLLNGIVYPTFAHNSDSYPYHGWMFGYKYDATQTPQFTQKYVFCTTPNGGDGGIWMAGKGPTADSAGNIYVSVGNGRFDADSKTAPNTDYGMCYLKLSPSLQVLDYFAPYDQETESNGDLDLGNTGLVGIPGTTKLFAGGTKFGAGFLLDSGNLGHFNPSPSAGFDGINNVVQRLDHITRNDSVGQNPIAWDAGGVKYVYLWANGSNLFQFTFNPASGLINPTTPNKQPALTGGGSLVVTSNGAANAILWAVDNNGILRAFDATDVSKTELWDSTKNSSRDSLGSVGHFQFPTAANGKIYVPTGSASIAVYGLLQAATPPPAVPTFSPAGGTYTVAQSVTISDTTAGASIFYTTNGSAPSASSSKYTGPITVSASETIKAVAILNGVSSALASAVYTISAPQNVTLAPLADSYVRAGYDADTNYGAWTILACKKVSNDSSTVYNRADYLKFDLTNVQAAPAHATLTLTVDSASNPARYSEQVQVYSVADTNWTERGITWNNAPGLNRTNFSSTGTLLSTVSVSLKPGLATFDLTAFVQANRGHVVTLQMLGATRQDFYLEFNSKEAASGRPQLAISY